MWLARWGLTTESWMDYIGRAVLRRAWADELDDIVREYSEFPRESISEVLRFAAEIADRHDVAA